MLAAVGIAFAEPDCELVVEDALVFLPYPKAKSAALYFALENTCAVDIALVGVSSDGAKHTMLHTTELTADGVSVMRQVEGGFEVAAGGFLEFTPGGDHVMLMGLVDNLEDGSQLEFDLHFAGRDDVPFTAGVSFEIP